MDIEIIKAFSKLLDEKFEPINDKLNEHSHLLKTLENKIDSNHNKLLEKLDELEAKNANRHIEINTETKNISKNLKFIKHKLHQTEEEVFDIKDHLKLIK